MKALRSFLIRNYQLFLFKHINLIALVIIGIKMIPVITRAIMHWVYILSKKLIYALCIIFFTSATIQSIILLSSHTLKYNSVSFTGI